MSFARNAALTAMIGAAGTGGGAVIGGFGVGSSIARNAYLEAHPQSEIDAEIAILKKELSVIYEAAPVATQVVSKLEEAKAKNLDANDVDQIVSAYYLSAGKKFGIPKDNIPPLVRQMAIQDAIKIDVARAKGVDTELAAKLIDTFTEIMERQTRQVEYLEKQKKHLEDPRTRESAAEWAGRTADVSAEMKGGAAIGAVAGLLMAFFLIREMRQNAKWAEESPAR